MYCNNKYFGITPCLVSFAIQGFTLVDLPAVLNYYIQYVRTSLEFQTFKISKIDFLISSNFKIRIGIFNFKMDFSNLTVGISNFNL